MLAQLGTEITSASWFGTADAAAMAVTDGNSPARVQRRAGISVRVEDADNDGKASDGADDGDDCGRIWTCARGDARACRPRGIFCNGFAPWVHDRASRVHRAVT